MVSEAQGNESTSAGSEGSEGQGSEKESSSSSEKMPDDPSNAEGGLEAAEIAAQQTEKAKIAAGYAPNFKFRVLDQEKEFDPWIKAAIKDADTEKKVRELYEKAHGLDFVKGDRQKVREQNLQLQNEVAQQTTVISEVNGMLRNKDYDSLFSKLQIPENDILAHAMKIIKLREMPPEQKAVYDAQRQSTQRAAELERQNQFLSQGYQQVAVNARTQELDWTLQRPEISEVAKAYETRTGIPGSFKQAVIERGQYHAYANGQDISAEQAANEVIRMLGGPAAFKTGQSQPAPIAAVETPVAQVKKPVITNIRGNGTSPAKKTVGSIADLKRIAREKAGANA